MSRERPIYLTAAQVVRLHDYQIEAYGGVAGLRDEGLLLSALAQPEMELFGAEVHPELADKAAAYLFHLSRNHAFHDANKRTALHTMLVFLRLNGYRIRGTAEPTDDKLFDLVLNCASGKLDKTQVSAEITSLLENL